MKDNLYLSYSQISNYQRCPAKWKIEKIDRLVPIWKGSPLLFGGAFDAASEYLLLNLGIIDLLERTKNVFISKMEQTEINIKEIKCKNTDLIRYSNRDIQPELYNIGLINWNIEERAKELDLTVNSKNFPKFVKEFQQLKKEKKELDKSEQLMYDYLCWHSLTTKGLMFIERFYQWVEENVKEVHSCQRKIEIENQVGDKYVGYLDFDVTLKNGMRYTYDLKTSSDPKKYYMEGLKKDQITQLSSDHMYYDGLDNNSASESFQLGVYSQEVKNPNVGYLVFDKIIRKRDPRVRMYEIRGKVKEETLDKHFNEIDTCLHSIKNEEFYKNEDNCFMFGKCEYYHLCHHGSKKGLVVKNEKK